ncbi:MAG: ketoacyl-ACP synthase III [Acidobacteria bacterium]|nr:MAG: ketoacyl-ACP synthase III [Acidobacteriota bacterium]
MNSPLARFLIPGVGVALPRRVLDNRELGRVLGLDPASIAARTGIEERRVAEEDDSASSLGARAAAAALAAAGGRPETIDLLLLSTYTPDFPLCPTAPLVARQLGAVRAGAFDINAACAGGVAALVTAASMIRSGPFRRALVVASDLTTRYIREDDPKTRLVFGDGAAALLIERAPEDPAARCWSLLAVDLGADGSGAHLFRVPAGGSAGRPLNGVRSHAPLAIEMNGRAIFRFGVEKGVEVLDRLRRRAGLGPGDVAWVIPHQANLRIISAMIDRSGIPKDRWYVNIERYGNTASSSVPIALAELVRAGRIAPGDIVLLVAFGAGLTWSGAALRAG